MADALRVVALSTEFVRAQMLKDGLGLGGLLAANLGRDYVAVDRKTRIKLRQYVVQLKRLTIRAV